jgi:primosomal protein N' (replication factor Y)
MAARHDSAGFLDREVGRRRQLGYPPFSHLVRVVLRSPSERRVEEAAAALATALRESLPDGTELLGPAPMFRVRNRHRRRLLTKAQEREATVAAIRDAVDRLTAERAFREVAIGVDVDPQ